MRSVFALATILTGALALHPAMVTAQTYDLPLLADDLNALERAYTFDHAQTTTQKFGYDISMRRLTEDDKWSSLKDGVTKMPGQPKNENRVIYGKPFYAMRDGTIVSCWRKLLRESASVHVRRRRKEGLWLHPERRAGRIGGGGNSVYVLHDDGRWPCTRIRRPGRFRPLSARTTARCSRQFPEAVRLPKRVGTGHARERAGGAARSRARR